MPMRKKKSVKSSRSSKVTAQHVPKPMPKKNCTPAEILAILDKAASVFTFPCLDNGYVYLADARLSLYRSDANWGLVIEIFGFNNRLMSPELSIFSFGNILTNRQSRAQYVSTAAYNSYLKGNPYNEAGFYCPVSAWEMKNTESVKPSGYFYIRGKRVAIPSIADYQRAAIAIDSTPNPQDLCRYLACSHREEILGTDEERLQHIDLPLILTLNTWYHPDTTRDENPSASSSFIQFAEMLAGERQKYSLSGGNTHWSNWPEGGTL